MTRDVTKRALQDMSGTNNKAQDQRSHLLEMAPRLVEEVLLPQVGAGELCLLAQTNASFRVYADDETHWEKCYIEDFLSTPERDATDPYHQNIGEVRQARRERRRQVRQSAREEREEMRAREIRMGAHHVTKAEYAKEYQRRLPRKTCFELDWNGGFKELVSSCFAHIIDRPALLAWEMCL